jgi:hypothetical protein
MRNASHVVEHDIKTASQPQQSIKNRLGIHCLSQRAAIIFSPVSGNRQSHHTDCCRGVNMVAERAAIVGFRRDMQHAEYFGLSSSGINLVMPYCPGILPHFSPRSATGFLPFDFSRRALLSIIGNAHATSDSPDNSQASRISCQSASDTRPNLRPGNSLYAPRSVGGRPRFGFIGFN